MKSKFIFLLSLALVCLSTGASTANPSGLTTGIKHAAVPSSAMIAAPPVETRQGFCLTESEQENCTLFLRDAISNDRINPCDGLWRLSFTEVEKRNPGGKSVSIQVSTRKNEPAFTMSIVLTPPSTLGNFHQRGRLTMITRFRGNSSASEVEKLKAVDRFNRTNRLKACTTDTGFVVQEETMLDDFTTWNFISDCICSYVTSVSLHLIDEDWSVIFGG